jgi:hypothetical protein
MFVTFSISGPPTGSKHNHFRIDHHLNPIISNPSSPAVERLAWLAARLHIICQRQSFFDVWPDIQNTYFVISMRVPFSTVTGSQKPYSY